MHLDWVGLGVIVLVPLVVVLGALVSLLLSRGPKPANREQLLPPLLACQEALDLTGDPATELHSGPVRVLLEDPDKAHLPNLVVSVREAPGGLNRQLPFSADRIRPILMRRETREDRIGKLLLINRELQTGDATFDDHVYVETSASFDIASEALSDPRVRDRVQQLLDDAWTRVVIHGRDLARVEQIPTDEASIEPERIRRAVDHLSALANVLVPVVAERAESNRLSHRFLTGVLVMLWLTGAALTIAGVQLWPPVVLTPFFVCAAAALILFLIGAPLLGLLVRGRSDSLHTLYGLLVWQAVAVVPLCVGAGLVVNGAFDEGEREEYVARVLSVDSTSASSRLATHYAWLESWHPDHDTVIVPISRAQYHEIGSREQVRLRVSVGQGALGWPWCGGAQTEP